MLGERLKPYLIALFVTASVCLSSVAVGASVVFDVTEGGIGGDLESSGSATVGGVAMTASSNIGVINATSDRLGINQPDNPPSPSDDPAAFDSVPLNELLFMSFDTTVETIAINFVMFDAGDKAVVSIGANVLPTITSSDLSSGGILFLDLVIVGNTTITLASDPNSVSPWAIRAIEINGEQPIPLPASVGLMGLALTALRFCRRKSA